MNKLTKATRALAMLGATLLLASACSGATSADGSSGSTPSAGPATTAPGAPGTPGTSGAPATNGATANGAEPQGSPAAGNGCRANDVKRPSGARTAPTADVDLDGEADTIWLADVDQQRTLGITTASGATFSTTFRSAAPQTASAVAQKMGSAGPAIVLLNGGRSVLVYDVVSCQLVPTENAQGQQYTFDLGFTGYGTGVECVRTGSGSMLAGLLAAPESSGGGYRVTRTTVALSNFGKQARNGVTTTLARHAAADSAVVRQARTVSCGSGAQVTEGS